MKDFSAQFDGFNRLHYGRTKKEPDLPIFRNYENNSDYKFIFKIEFPDAKDDENAFKIEQMLLMLEQRRDLGIEPSLSIEATETSSNLLTLKLFSSWDVGKKSTFIPASAGCIKDEIVKLRCDWKEKSVVKDKEKGIWINCLPSIPEKYPRRPVPILLPAVSKPKLAKPLLFNRKFKQTCGESNRIQCPKFNRFIIEAKSKTTISNEQEKNKSELDQYFLLTDDSKSLSTTSPSINELFPNNYDKSIRENNYFLWLMSAIDRSSRSTINSMEKFQEMVANVGSRYKSLPYVSWAHYY